MGPVPHALALSRRSVADAVSRSGRTFEGRFKAFLNMRKNSTQQNTASDPSRTRKGSWTDILKIADIAIRDDWQVRNKIDHNAVTRYRTVYKNGGSLPPH